MSCACLVNSLVGWNSPARGKIFILIVPEPPIGRDIDTSVKLMTEDDRGFVSDCCLEN